jgi:hypothetical protein
VTPHAFAKRAASEEVGGGCIANLRPVAGLLVLLATLSLDACKDSPWTPMGSAEVVLSQIKLGGSASVARRVDADESFGRSVMNGIATGDSLWLEVASKFSPASATAEASVSIALATALPRAPAGVLRLLGEKYPVESVCGIPFFHVDSAFVATYHDNAIDALGRVRDTLLTRNRDACRSALDTAQSEKLTRINPGYIVKNNPAPPPARAKKRPAKQAPPQAQPVTPPDTSSSA